MEIHYDFESDDSWVFGTKSIHNFKPQFMKRFRFFVFLGIVFDFNMFILWFLGVSILGSFEAWFVLFPSLLYIPRIALLIYTLFFEYTPYKIASSQFYHLLEEGFNPGQYKFLRALGTHGGWGGFGVWCGVSKFIHMPIMLFSIIGFIVTLIFHDNNDLDLLLFSIGSAILALFETPIVDFIIVYFGVMRPRDSYQNAPEEIDDIIKDFI